MTYRWDYRTAPLVRLGFWTVLVLAGFGLSWAGRTEVGVYTAGEGHLERGADGGVRFRMRLRESDLAKVQVGMPALVNWVAYPKAQYGLSQGRVQGTEVNQQIEAVVVLDSPTLDNRTLQPGLSGSAQIVLSRKKAVDLLWEWLRGE